MRYLICLLLAASALGQQVFPPSGGSGSGVTSVAALPATCTPPKQVYLTTGVVGYYNCTGTNVWSMVGTRPVLIEGVTHGGASDWQADYLNLNNGSFTTVDATHQKPKLSVLAGGTLLSNNPIMASGTFGSVTSGSQSGTGTCVWTTTGTPVGGIAATGTVPISAGSIALGATLTITTAGAYFLTAPINVSLSNGTGGNCNGTATISATLSDTPYGPYKIVPVTTTNPTITFVVEVASADNVNAGSMALAYACVPLGSNHDNPTRTALTPIALTTIPTYGAAYTSAQQVTCAGTAASPSDLYVYFTPTAPSGGALINYRWWITY